MFRVLTRVGLILLALVGAQISISERHDPDYDQLVAQGLSTTRYPAHRTIELPAALRAQSLPIRQLVQLGVAIPPWVQSLGPILPDEVVNWTLNQGWTKRGGLTTPSAMGITTVRNSPKQVVDSNGNWSQVAANTTGVSNLGRSTEELRINSIRNSIAAGSVSGTPGTLPTNWISSNTNTTQTVVGSGTDSGLSYIDIGLVFSAAGTYTLQFDGGGTIAAAYGQTWASTLFVSVVGGSTANLTFEQLISENAVGGGFINASASVFTPGNGAGTLGANRAPALSRTMAASNTGATINALRVIASAAGAVTVRIGWPQIENNSLITATVASAVVTSGGTVCLNGTDTFTVVGGTGTAATFTGTVTGGVLGGTLTVVNPGSYTVFPPSPASTTGGTCTTQPTVTLTPTNNAAEAFATSPIVTSGSAAVRQADVTTLTASFGSAFTLFSAATPNAPTSYPGNQNVFEAFADSVDRSSTRKIGGTGLSSFGTVGGSNTTVVGAIWNQGTLGTIAVSLAVGAQALSFNNGTPVTMTPASIPATPTSLTFGAGNAGSAFQFDGLFTKDAWWLNQAVPNSQLQSMQ